MTAGTLARDLGELERGLESLLACFESERFPAPETIDATWAHVFGAFESVQTELAHDAQTDQRAALARCQRLYAVAVAVLTRRREELAGEREACAEARRRLARIRPEGQSGASCDVRG